MTAWVKKGTKESIGIIVDFTDNEYVLIADYFLLLSLMSILALLSSISNWLRRI